MSANSIILSIPDVSLRTPSSSEAGLLSLGTCFGAGKSTANEAALVLRLNAHSFPIHVGLPISLTISSGGGRTYSFQPGEIANEEKQSSSKEPPAIVHLTIPCPHEDSQDVAEAIGTFDQILNEYADLCWKTHKEPDSRATPFSISAHGTPGSSAGNDIHDQDFRGHLVLVDEDSGQVVGTLPQKLSITEDPALRETPPQAGADASSVVVELPPDVYDAYTGAVLGGEGEELLQAREVFVRAIPPDQQDWMTKSATLVSQAISSSTSLLLSGMTSASNYYISCSKPASSQPTTSSPSPSAPATTPSTSTTALAHAHALSGHAAYASSRTVDFVDGVIRLAVGAKSEPATKPRTTRSAPPPPLASMSPPPYSVYAPKPRVLPGPRSGASSPAPPLPPRSPVPPREKGASRSASWTPVPAGAAPLAEGNEPRKAMRTRDRVMLSVHLVLSTVDDSARRVFEVGSNQLEAVVGHKYGSDAQQSTHHATHTARNVVLMYIDMSGFARRALLKKVGKEFVKAHVGGKAEIKTKKE